MQVTSSDNSESALKNFFLNNKGRLVHKYMHYFEAYENHFLRFKGKDIVILEIGVSQGGSLQMWKSYFGPGTKVYGIDIDPGCKNLEEENVEIFIGSQTDRKFLNQIKQEIPPIDILIDDGGHTMKQQIITFQELFGHVKENGVYLCEDCHTSYWLKYGGGKRRRGTFIEFSKKIIDKVNAYHSEQRSLKVDEYTHSIGSLHFYDSIVVFEKCLREKPYSVKTGEESFDQSLPRYHGLMKVVKKSRMAILFVINSILRFLRLPGFFWR